MRRYLVAGNWKMHKNLEEAKELASSISNLSSSFPNNTDVLICVPAPLIEACVNSCDNGVWVGAQNCHFKTEGAFTGEVSVSMLKSVGATHCIVGHSERRQIFGETDQNIAMKVAALITGGLTPIFCCGEQLPERQNGKHFEVVMQQLEIGLFGLSDDQFSKVIIAYEPVWAIGTGETATPEQAQEIHAFIRQEISKKFGEGIASQTQLLYGGSCKPDNAVELFACPDVDGGLIGGAALRSESFVQIIKAAG